VQPIGGHLDLVDGLAERDTGSEVERQGHRGKHALVTDRQRLDRRDHFGKGGERHLCSVRAGNVELRQRRRVALELRLDFEDHLVLSARGVDRRDLALAERVVERLVDQCGVEAEPVRGVAVDIDRHGRRGVLLVGGDVLQLRQFAHLGLEDRRPMIELLIVGIGQRVLILRSAEPPADRDILRHLHVEHGALDRGHLLAQALDHLIGGVVALLERL
jgi:hypothetical protein